MVLQIPISQTGSSDKLIWHFDPKGQYTVKSGYKQAIALISTSVSIGESSANPSSKFWRLILAYPDVSHILSVVATTCWFIWRSRNNFVFENVTPSPHNTLAVIYAQLNDHQKFVTHQSISSLTSAATNLDSTSHTSPQWIPPGSSVKLNCDAAFKNSSAAFGIVARDCAGLFRYVIGNRCRGVSPLHAEIIAVHFACSLVFNHGWFNAIVESDSQIAISLSSLDTSPP
ncbi:reverse transcriptase [Tanacetum coccineum]|uniref:Reverse transcriptase n=1 Tax=Tanacetum coccineum TaxID=301880 RepID=A0ABQ5FTK6_9ASTR